MQAIVAWSAPGGVLGELVAEARARAAALGARDAELDRAAADAPRPPGLAAALRRADVAVIAEIKRRSPSKGDLAPDMRLAERAAAYADAGAAALSVLTQTSRFGGTADDLAEAARTVRIPLLRKDFIVDPRQVIEARALGASAVLLIARALPPAELAALAAVARDVGLETLVEVRDAAELDAALGAGATIVGVNNRNLETLAIDDAVSAELLPRIPADRPAVYESGVAERADVERAAAYGADAVLVGSALSGAADPHAAAAALTGVARGARGG